MGTVAKKPCFVKHTGPYKFVEWAPGEGLVVETADRPHFSGQPRVNKLTWRPVSEGTTRVVELKTGQAYLITPVDPVQVPELEGDPNTSVLAYRQLNSLFVNLNMLKVEALQDVRVRQALNYATDVDTKTAQTLALMAYYLLRRLQHLFWVLLAVSILVFLLIYLWGPRHPVGPARRQPRGRRSRQADLWAGPAAPTPVLEFRAQSSPGGSRKFLAL